MTRIVNVQDHEDYQARRFGDWTCAAQRAISEAACNAIDHHGGAVVYFPPGQYKITKTLRIGCHHMHIVGDGSMATRIMFIPDEDDQALWKFQAKPESNINFLGANWDPITNCLWGCSIKALTILSKENLNRQRKTAIELIDVQTFYMENIQVQNSFLGYGSTGLHIKGRDTTHIQRLEIVADRPVVISRNPNSAAGCALTGTALDNAITLLKSRGREGSPALLETTLNETTQAARYLHERAADAETTATRSRILALAKRAEAIATFLTRAQNLLTNTSIPDYLNTSVGGAEVQHFLQDVALPNALVTDYTPHIGPFNVYDADHFHFQDCLLITGDTPDEYAVEIASSNVNALTFDGYQAWASSCGGIKIHEPVPRSLAFTANQIAIHNVRLEGPGLLKNGWPASSSNPKADDGWFAYVKPGERAVIGLIIENVLSNAANGIYLDGVNQASIRHFNCSGLRKRYRIAHFGELTGALDAAIQEIMTALPPKEVGKELARLLKRTLEAGVTPPKQEAPEILEAFYKVVEKLTGPEIVIVPPDFHNTLHTQTIGKLTDIDALVKIGMIESYTPMALLLNGIASSINIERFYHGEGQMYTPDEYTRVQWITGNTASLAFGILEPA